MAHSPHLMRIRQCYPDMIFSQVQLDTDGKTTDVLIINEERVFRFPRTHQAEQSIWREAAVLKIVGRHVKLRVPDFDRVENDFASYQLIPGRHLLRNRFLRMPASDQERILEDLGEFLTQLAAVPQRELDEAGIGFSSAYRGREAWLKFYEAVERDLFPIMLTHTREWVQEHFAPFLADPAWMDVPLSFVNGNLGPYHILYDPADNSLAGILDFGRAGSGDPAQDAAVLLYYYGEGFLRRLARYWPVLEGMIERARFIAGTVELQWALEGIQNSDSFGTLGYVGSARDALPPGSGWE